VKAPDLKSYLQKVRLSFNKKMILNGMTSFYIDKLIYVDIHA